MKTPNLGNVLYLYLGEDLAKQQTRGTEIDFYWYGRFCLKASLKDDDLPLLVQASIEELQAEIVQLCQERQINWIDCINLDEMNDLIWEVADRQTPEHRKTVETLHFLYSKEFDEIFASEDDYFISGKDQLQECIHFYLKREMETFCQQLIQESTASPS